MCVWGGRLCEGVYMCVCVVVGESVSVVRCVIMCARMQAVDAVVPNIQDKDSHS